MFLGLTVGPDLWDAGRERDVGGEVELLVAMVRFWGPYCGDGGP